MFHLIHIILILGTGATPVLHKPVSFVEAAVVRTGLPEDTVKHPQPSRSIEAARENVLRPGERVADKIRKNLFVRVTTNKASCYVGEPIVVQYKLYSRLVAKSRIIKQPSLNGFTVYDMIDFIPLDESVETVQGKRYNVHTLRKTQLIPLQTGALELDAMELENTIEFIKSKDVEPRKGNQLDDLLGTFLEEESAPAVSQSSTTKSTPLTVSVKPLPDNDRPSFFNGAVGQFSIRAAIDSVQLTARSAAVLSVEISGKGNLALIDAPDIEWPAGFESVDVRSSEELNKAVFPLEGTRRFEYSFIAENEGNFHIPPVTFAYFDPSRNTYKTVSTKPLPVVVSPGTAIVRSPEPELPRSVPAQPTSVSSFLKTHLGWFLVLLLALIGMLFMWMRTLHRGIKTGKVVLPDPKPGQKPATTPAMPKVHPLQQTRKLLSNGDPHAFYTELNKVLLNTLGEKLKRSPGELYKPYIVKQLQLKGWTETMTANLIFLLGECEKNLYSSSDMPGKDMAATLHLAERVIADLQKWS